MEQTLKKSDVLEKQKALQTQEKERQDKIDALCVTIQDGHKESIPELLDALSIYTDKLVHKYRRLICRLYHESFTDTSVNTEGMSYAYQNMGTTEIRNKCNFFAILLLHDKEAGAQNFARRYFDYCTSQMQAFVDDHVTKTVDNREIKKERDMDYAPNADKIMSLYNQIKAGAEDKKPELLDELEPYIDYIVFKHVRIANATLDTDFARNVCRSTAINLINDKNADEQSYLQIFIALSSTALQKFASKPVKTLADISTKPAAATEPEVQPTKSKSIKAKTVSLAEIVKDPYLRINPKRFISNLKKK